MKRFTLVLTLCLTLCLAPSHITTSAQDEPVWKYLGSLKNEQTGEETSFYVRDSYRFTDKESEKYPKLAVRSSRSGILKEYVAEFDCKRRAMRTRIWIYINGKEEKATELDWLEVVPTSPGEAFLDYACRDRSKEKQ
jgi:hypothetical protein